MRAAAKRSSKRRDPLAVERADDAPLGDRLVHRRVRIRSRRLDELGHRALAQARTGVPHAIASIMTRPNGSGQSIGNSSAVALPRNAVLVALAHLADELDAGAEERYDGLRKYGSSTASTLAAMRSGTPARRDPDGPVEALLRRHPAEEGEVTAARGRVERAGSGESPWYTVASQFIP